MHGFHSWANGLGESRLAQHLLEKPNHWPMKNLTLITERLFMSGHVLEKRAGKEPNIKHTLCDLREDKLPFRRESRKAWGNPHSKNTLCQLSGDASAYTLWFQARLLRCYPITWHNLNTVMCMHVNIVSNNLCMTAFMLCSNQNKPVLWQWYSPEVIHVCWCFVPAAWVPLTAWNKRDH